VRCLLAHVFQLFCGHVSEQQGEELLFKRAQVALEFFAGERLLRKLFQPGGDLSQCGQRRGDVAEGRCCIAANQQCTSPSDCCQLSGGQVGITCSSNGICETVDMTPEEVEISRSTPSAWIQPAEVK